MSERALQEHTCTWLQKREPSTFDAHISRPQNCLWTTGNHGHLPARSNITRMEFTVTLLRLINTVRVQEPGPSGKVRLVWSGLVRLTEQASSLFAWGLPQSQWLKPFVPKVKMSQGMGGGQRPSLFLSHTVVVGVEVILGGKSGGCMVGLRTVFGS